MSFGQYLYFEYLGIVLKGAPRILFIIVYRPPKYYPAFVEEFTELLSMISSEFEEDWQTKIISEKINSSSEYEKTMQKS